MERNSVAKVVGSAKWGTGQRKPHEKGTFELRPDVDDGASMWIFRGRILQCQSPEARICLVCKGAAWKPRGWSRVSEVEGE